MRTLYPIEEYRGRATEYTITYLTDLHVGARACDEKGIRAVVRDIEENEYARWIGGGDYVDAICHVGDKRYQPSKLASWLHGVDDVMGRQRDYVCEMLQPIMGKCWGLVKGNHEHAALKWYGRDLYAEIVTILAGYAGKPPEDLALTVHGFVCVKFRRLSGEKGHWGGTTLPIYAAHGYGGGRLPGSHALTLGRILGSYRCKLALVGHRHVNLYWPQTVVVPYKKTARAEQAMGLFCGSMLGAYITPPKNGIGTDTYAEHAGYVPSPTGLATVTVNPDKLKLTAHNSISLADETLDYDA